MIEVAAQEIGKKVVESNLSKLAKEIPNLNTNIVDLDKSMVKEIKEPDKCLLENKNTFNTLDEMKEWMGLSYKEIKEQKPDNSPNIVKWFDQGGTLEVAEKDGKPVWNYTNPEGITVSYVDGYPVFSPETKHPYIDDIDIGSFTGDREKDKKAYKKILEEDYGLTEIPEGYVLHHDAENGKMQLVKTEYHEEFTHAGGHSKFKEE